MAGLMGLQLRMRRMSRPQRRQRQRWVGEEALMQVLTGCLGCPAMECAV